MEEKIKLEKLNEFERLVAIIILKINSDRAFKNENVQPLTKKYLKEMMVFLEKKGVLENDLSRIN